MNTIFACPCGGDRFVRTQKFHIDGPIVAEQWDGKEGNLPTIHCVECGRAYELFKGVWVLSKGVD
jgi:hypothetical protein